MIEERHQKILDILSGRQFASVSFLSNELFVSKPTIRRDLTYLQEKNLINRSYGGAMAKSYRNEVPIEFRNGIKIKEKTALSKAAVKLIEHDDIVFIDSSTTTLPIVSFLKERKDITVITNGLQVLNALRNTNVRVYCVGGSMIQNSYAFVGKISERILEQFSIDIMFFSSYSVSEAGIISDYSEVETDTRRAALRQSRKKVFLCDNEKIGRNSAFIVTTTDKIDYFITNYKQPLNFKNKNLSLITV